MEFISRRLFLVLSIGLLSACGGGGGGDGVQSSTDMEEEEAPPTLDTPERLEGLEHYTLWSGEPIILATSVAENTRNQLAFSWMTDNQMIGWRVIDSENRDELGKLNTVSLPQASSSGYGLALGSAQNVMISWATYDPESSPQQVYTQFFLENGEEYTPVITVDTDVGAYVTGGPTIASYGSGIFEVYWNKEELAFSSSSGRSTYEYLFYRPYLSDGTPMDEAKYLDNEERDLERSQLALDSSMPIPLCIVSRSPAMETNGLYLGCYDNGEIIHDAERVGEIYPDPNIYVDYYYDIAMNDDYIVVLWYEYDNGQGMKGDERELGLKLKVFDRLGYPITNVIDVVKPPYSIRELRVMINDEGAILAVWDNISTLSGVLLDTSGQRLTPVKRMTDSAATPAASAAKDKFYLGITRWDRGVYDLFVLSTNDIERLPDSWLQE